MNADYVEGKAMSVDVRAIEIVRAGAEDVEIVAPLFDAYRQFYKLPSNVDAARRYLHARLLQEEAVIFLALEEQRAGAPAAGPYKSAAKEAARTALGFTLLYPTWSSLSLRRWWNLNDLYVTPEARKRGVARALMARAQQLAENTGASGLGLETAKDNYPAQQLYEQLGWKRDEEFFRYELHV
jgi:GNAT superfamily N-acetyltransferase